MVNCKSSFPRRHYVKFARIRVFSDPYFPVDFAHIRENRGEKKKGIPACFAQRELPRLSIFNKKNSFIYRIKLLIYLETDRMNIRCHIEQLS